ncbi:MAG: thioredoxin family protein [Bacteroidota bacterium]
MKYFVAVLLLLVAVSTPFADEKGVEFVSMDLDEALASARAQEKMVLIDVWADGCAPCKRLEKQVFSENEVGGFVNSRFVCLKVNVKDTLGKQIHKKYEVAGFPTVLFLDSGGGEIDRLFGYDDDPDSYFKTLQEYASGKNTLRSMLSRLEREPDDVDLNYAIAVRYVDRGQGLKSPAYFTRILELDPEDQKGYAEDARFSLAVADMWTKDKVEPLAAFLKKTTNEKLLWDGYNFVFKYNRNNENHDAAIAAYARILELRPGDADRMNACAWYIYENEMSEKYEWGIQIAREAVSLKPEAAHIWDTVAWLEYVGGSKARAIEAMKRAVELSPDKGGYKKNLQKMEGGV